MTEADNQLIHAYVEPEGFDKSRCPVCGWPLRPTIDEGCTAESCSMRPVPVKRADEPPDYSTRQHFPDLTDKLFGDERMWKEFYYWTENSEQAPDTYDIVEIMAWLFFDYARFVALFAEFLRLESTVREFGYMKCTDCNGKYIGVWHKTGFCKHCTKGKIPTAWAKLVEEEK